MDATRRVACDKEIFNPVLTMGMQVAFILVLSHCFQLVLKPLGQPGPVAQILSGLVLGPSGLSQIGVIKTAFFQDVAGDYYETMALCSRIIIMFLMGLETDVAYFVRNLRRASIIAAGGCVICTIFAAAITPFIYLQTKAIGSVFDMGLMIAIILSNAASPIVTRLASELRFSTTDFGRLAISTSLITDAYAVFLLVFSVKGKYKYSFGAWAGRGFGCLVMVVVVIVINMYLANWLNRRNRNRKHLKNAEAFGILSLVVVTAMTIEMAGFSSIIACYLIGAMFPKGGKTARTLYPKLNYSVHNFIFPVYLGYMGFLVDVTPLKSLYNIAIVIIVILLSLGGKISGILGACYYLKIPLNEGVLLAFLTTLKGHVDLVTMGMGLQNKLVVSPIFYTVMMATIAFNTLLIGPLIAYMVKRESQSLGYEHITLEWHEPEAEFRLLACVHNPRHVSTMVGLISSLRGSEKGPITPYLMHLIELPEKTKTNLMYHQREDDELSDEESYGGNEVGEINEAVDNFTAETGVMVQQVKAVSPFATMHWDVCDRAEDMRAFMILLHFHKHQRIDGKMETGKVGIRRTNQKVLRYAKCTVGILVDRGLTRAPQVTGVGSDQSLQHVATLFFGGADDREALGFSRRLSMHHHINLTVIRFLPAASKDVNVGMNVARKEDDVLLAIADHESESEADTTVLTEFFNRYVTSGQVGYIEKYVENGRDTAMALREMADMYSLFIVGKDGRGNSPLTTGISDWEECPELGTVGDLLASSDFDNSGSVLVLQQHRMSLNEEEEDDEDR